ncbi:regulator of G protein [Ectocarpus siliculosus]|uniref:Regulator of G protein n=1 Tax=Ectocarpus siliculosus TaxID=2880 RepID=D7G5I5_ECTSI|nr:regulator of G protein [Ectocarpus siliculosus]|eukprot:CBJ27308.1 regulator of G protein [Ectocarpus siliculosus]
MERRRGDGNGVSDEEEEEGKGVLGRPSEKSWSDGLSADPLGVRRGGDFFPGDSPAVSPAAAHDGGVIVVVGGKETAAAAKRRHGADRVGLKAPDASPDLEGETGKSEGEGDDARSGSGSGSGSVRWWSLRQPSEEGAGGEGEGRWWSPLPQQPDDEDTPAWWSGRGKSSASTGGGGAGGGGAGGEDGRRWSSPSSLFAQAVSAFSAIGPPPPPAPPPAVPSRSGVSTVAAQEGGGGGGLAAAVGGGAGGASAGGGVSGDVGVSAEPGTAADKGGGGVRALAERPRVLLELPFFCKENGTEEMRAVLENADLRAGFKQFLAKRLCAENLVFVEDVMRYQEMVVGVDAESASAPVAALQLGGEIEEKYLSESSRLEVNIGDDMRKDCVARRARDVELARASLDTFTPVVLELLSLMVHSSLPEFRGSAHYATIKACLYMGPRGTRNSGATSSLTHEDEWGTEDDEDDSFEQEDF